MKTKVILHFNVIFSHVNFETPGGRRSQGTPGH